MTSLGSKVISTSSSHSRLINGDNSAIGVSDKTGIRSISSSIVVGSTGINTTNNTMGSQVISTSSNHGRLISRGHSAIGVSDQSGDMEGSSIAIGNRVSQRSSNRGNNRASNMASSNNRGSSAITSSIVVGSTGINTTDNTMGSQVVSTSSNNSRLISRGHSAVGVGDQGGKMEGTSVAIGNRVSQGSCNRGNNRGSNMGCSHNRGSSSISISSAIGSKLGGQVISTVSCNGRLVNGGHSSIGVGLKSEKSGCAGGSNTGSKNQKLHDVLSCCVLELNSH